MKSKLEILIEYYTAQKEKLEELLQECVLDEDYKTAFFYKQEIYRSQNFLRIFGTLNDQNFTEKEWLRRIITADEKALAKEQSQTMKNFLSENIKAEQKNLEELERVSLAERQKIPEPEILNQTLQQVFNKEIKFFRLVLNSEKTCYMDFNRTAFNIKITIPKVKSLQKNFYIDTERLLAKGFRFTNRNNKLLFSQPFKTDADLARLKTFLSIIIFEVFPYESFRNKSYIELG